MSSRGIVKLKLDIYLKNHLDKYLSATLLTLYIKFPALVATHILGRLAAVYLTESGSIKMRLPSHLDSHMWLNTVRIPDTTSIGLM